MSKPQIYNILWEYRSWRFLSHVTLLCSSTKIRNIQYKEIACLLGNHLAVWLTELPWARLENTFQVASWTPPSTNGQLQCLNVTIISYISESISKTEREWLLCVYCPNNNNYSLLSPKVRSPPCIWRGPARSTQGLKSVEQLGLKSSCPPPFASGSWETPQSSVHSPRGERDLLAILSLLSSEE